MFDDIPKSLREWEDAITKGIQENLTKERAELVKAWRTKGASWRWVASKAYYVWDEPSWLCEGHQIYGMRLCEVAATLLGEDPSKEPWN